jgi:hypothetical protein
MVYVPLPHQVTIPGFFFPDSPTIPWEKQDVVGPGDERWIGGTFAHFIDLGLIHTIHFGTQYYD